MANLNITARLQDEASGPADRIGTSVRGIEREATIASSGFSALQTVGVAALGAILTALTVVTVALAAFTTGGIRMAMDMEASMSDIAAVLNTTQEEIAPLGDLIRDLGLNPNLKVTAEEAASAIDMLARNGLNMTQILDGAAESTVLLANATGATFDTAANIATDSMAIFNIQAEDMMTAVNGITSVTTASKFGIQDYALALAQGGGVASAVGVEFEDFNTTIAAISPLFASGSDAGTSLKTMLVNLVPSSNKAEDAMEALGIITQEGSNQFFDAQGNLKSMAEIAGVLEGALTGLSEEQQNEALKTIFGNDAMRAAVGLFRTGEEGFRELQETMGETDAMESAATRMDNLAGKTEILWGIIETVQLSLGQAFLPVLTMLADMLLGIADQAMPAIIGRLEEFSNWLTTTGEAIAAGGFDELFTVFEDGSTRLEGLFEIFGLGEAQARNLAVSIIELVNQGVELVTWVADTVSQFIAWQDVAVAIGLAIASVIIPVLWFLIATFAPIVATFLAAVAVAALLRQAWETDFAGLRDFLGGVWLAIQQAYEAFKALFQGDFEGFTAGIRTAWETGWNALISFLGNIWALILPHLVNLGTNIQNWFTTQDWGAIGQTLFTRLLENAATGAAFIGEKLAMFLTAVTDWFNAQDWQQIGRDVMNFIGNGIVAAVALIGAYLTIWFTAFRTWSTSADWPTIGKNLVTAILSGLANFLLGIGSVLAGWGQAFWNWVSGVDWAGIGNRIVTAIQTALGNFVARAGGELTKWYLVFIAWVNSQDWKQIGYDVVTAVLEGLLVFSQWVAGRLIEWYQAFTDWRDSTDWEGIAETAVERILQALILFVTGLPGQLVLWYNAFTTWFGSQDWGSLAQKVIDGIVAGLAAGAQAVVNALGDVMGGAAAAWDDFWESHSPSRRATRQSGDVIAGYEGGIRAGAPAMMAAGVLLASSIVGGWEDEYGRTGPFIPRDVVETISKIDAAATRPKGEQAADDFIGGWQDEYGNAGPFIPADIADTMSKIIPAVDPYAIGTNLGELLVAGVTDATEALDIAGALGRIGGGIGQIFQSRILDPLESEIGGLENQIEDVLSGPLQDAMRRFGAESLQDLVNIAGVFHGAFTGAELDALAEAVDLENLRVEAAAEYAAQQEHLLELQRQQQDLQFLQQQLDLLELIAEHGLDPDAILGGLTLGLDASLPDLLDAMTAAMQAVIGQAEAELGIASPSMVMRDIMLQAGRGAVIGLDTASSMISDAAVGLADSLLQPFTTATLSPVGVTAEEAAPTQTIIIENLILYGVENKEDLLEQLQEYIV